MNTDRDSAMPSLQKAWLLDVDSKKPATAKQKYMLAKHFAVCSAKKYDLPKSDIYPDTKRFSAIIHKYYTERPSTPLTHGDITNFMLVDDVPRKFEKMLIVSPDKPKASKAKAAPKPKAKATSKPVASEPKATAAAKKPSEMSIEEFKAQFNKLDSRVEATEKRLATVDAKLDIIMAYIQSNPDA